MPQLMACSSCGNSGHNKRSCPFVGEIGQVGDFSQNEVCLCYYVNIKKPLDGLEREAWSTVKG